MKINILIDPRVKGQVTVYTYGEVKPVDLMPFMQTILRVNGAAMVQVVSTKPVETLLYASNLMKMPLVVATPPNGQVWIIENGKITKDNSKK